MKVLRSALVAVAAASALLAGGPANAAGIVIVEGEAAVSYTAGCGDGGDAWDMGPVSYGGTQAMFFPASGCRATYRTGAETIVAARVLVSGVAPSVCGTITVSGTTAGAVAFCATADVWTTVNFNPPVVSAGGTYTVTWTTAPGTLSYANLFLDYMVGAGV